MKQRKAEGGIEWTTKNQKKKNEMPTHSYKERNKLPWRNLKKKKKKKENSKMTG